MRIAAVAAALLSATLALASVGSAHAESAVWLSAPAQAPPPPAGVAPAPYPVGVGEVGEISFWAPNRGLLITGGGGPVEPGLYAYDGKTWHQLSIVCGGGHGRIAWAGPDDFWTISDQRAGQVLPPGDSESPLTSLSLCHFEDGAVVGSYAMPLDEPDSYLPMDAAACLGPDDCWFGGEDGQGTNAGSFHLHWNGSTVTAVYEPSDHAVTSMVGFAGELFESVQIDEDDVPLPGEETKHPVVIHTIAPEGQTSWCDEGESPFCELPLFAEHEGLSVRLPEYGKGVLPDALQGFDLATDAPAGEGGATRLWAAADPVPGSHLPKNSKAASPTVLLDREGVWSQLMPNEEGRLPAGLEGYELAGGASKQAGEENESATSGAIAPEPGGERAWLSLAGGGGRGALVAAINANGTLAHAPEALPGSWEPEAIGYHGSAGPITCPGPSDCWMATSEGWLFHLADGSETPPDRDPMFDGEDGVIENRPKDDGIPTIYPDDQPPDDSLANQQPAPALPQPAKTTPAAKAKVKAKPLLEHVKSRFLHGRQLVVSFTLTAKAHVQLLGSRDGKVVASTPRALLKPGSHELSLLLDPSHWPSGIQFKATPLSGASAPKAPSSSNDSSDTIST